MRNLFWLTDDQIARLSPFFPKSHGKPRVDDRRVLSGMIFVKRNGLRWRDAPESCGPHRTLESRWKRWGDKGIFARMMAGPAAEHGEEKTVTIDPTSLKAHRTATGMAARMRGGVARHDRCPKMSLSAVTLAAVVIYWSWIVTLGFFAECNRRTELDVLQSRNTYMKVQINIHGDKDASAEVRAEIEEMLRDKLERFGDLLTRLELHIARNGEVNARMDHYRCGIEGRVAGKRPIRCIIPRGARILPPKAPSSS